MTSLYALEALRAPGGSRSSGHCFLIQGFPNQVKYHLKGWSSPSSTPVVKYYLQMYMAMVLWVNETCGHIWGKYIMPRQEMSHGYIPYQPQLSLWPCVMPLPITC